MQPTPMMPSYPAAAGGRGDGITAQIDSYCRSQGYEAAQKMKQGNLTREVASTAVGTLAGAVIGNNVGGGNRHDRKALGAVAGAATGAAASRAMTGDAQQAYDITYNNCIQSYRAGTSY